MASIRHIHRDLVQHSWWRSTLALWLFLWKHRTQRTWAFCPTCQVDLCSDGSFFEDTDLVRYICKNCGTKSEWDFDAPGPILIRFSIVR